MTTQQDILRTMMTQLDEASDKIPEGLYLQFCDHLKNLHPAEDDEYRHRYTSDPIGRAVTDAAFAPRDPGAHMVPSVLQVEDIEAFVSLFVCPIFYLIRFVYFRFKDIYSVIKTHRESRTDYEHNETFKMIQQAGLRMEATLKLARSLEH